MKELIGFDIILIMKTSKIGQENDLGAAARTAFSIFDSSGLTKNQREKALEDVRVSAVGYAKENELLTSKEFGAFVTVYYFLMSKLGFPSGPGKK